MSDVRRLIALLLAVMALGTAAFGVVRGLTKTGPAHGVRMVVAIDPPIDEASFTLAQRVVRERIEEKGVLPPRVMSGGQTLVVELGEDDPEIVALTVALLERTATVTVHVVDPNNPGDPAAQPVLFDRRTLRGAEVTAGGVAIDVADASRAKPGTTLAFVLDGKVHALATVDSIQGTQLHVVPRTTAQEATIAPFALAALVDAGAAHPLHVVKRETFSRATGFVPRAAPFLAIAAVFLIAAALVWRRR